MEGIVAVVGRPNVGKSTLFNRLVGKRMSIVDDTPGVTRDRIYAKAEWLGKEFMLIDTGGIEPDSKDVILSQMRIQAQLAIEKADVIILVTDITTGVTASDAMFPRNFMSFIILVLVSLLRYPLPMVTAPEIFWMRYLKICLKKVLLMITPRMQLRWRLSVSPMPENPHL